MFLLKHENQRELIKVGQMQKKRNYLKIRNGEQEVEAQDWGLVALVIVIAIAIYALGDPLISKISQLLVR
jgi:hypothetical protein